MPTMPNGIENQPYNPSITTPAAAEPFSWAGLIGTVFVFLIILMVSLWMIKRLNKYSVRNMQSPWARVLDRQVLNGQQVLYLVEIAGRMQVLGGTDHHITKVSEINDPDVVAEILEEIANRPEEQMDKLMTGIWKKLRRKPKNDVFSAELERLLEEVKR
ncbi:MAG: FliO/MopB family protein [Peptococcaceae bacterium]|nr:FliO/MopB family protein [Peptococcaceae bacterium]